MPNWSQISGVLERLITAGVMYAVGKGWIAGADASNVAALVLGLGSVFYAFFVNRNSNLLKQAASVTANGQSTTVVAPDDLAKALPQSNIIPTTEVKVVQK